MQVVSVLPGRALCTHQGERRTIGTALVGDVSAGDWLLVFLDDARERIDAQRASEIQTVLDWVAGAMQGAGNTEFSEKPFELPSTRHPSEFLR
jgi:hydrogenase expression/formation protein HypC